MSTAGTRTIVTPLGDVVARDNGRSVRATGLRYATAERFAPPVPVAPWSSPIDCTQPGRACPQHPSRFDWVTGPVTAMLEQSEDCLTVTVTAPSSHASVAPVLVFFQGGAYVSGSGECPAYDPTHLVEENDVVVVTVTYRLGVLGNLAIPGIAPANLGLMDQILALEWVRDNIATFGGDTDNVTILGQSAGGHSVYLLMLADGTDGLFRRVIMQSAPIGIATGRDAMVADMGRAAADMLGDSAGTCDVSRILEVESAMPAVAQPHGFVSGMAFAPQFGHAPLPAESAITSRITAAIARGVEVIIGSAAHDGAPYSMMAQGTNQPPFAFVSDFSTDAIGDAITSSFESAAVAFADSWRAAGGLVQRYVYDWHPSQTALGACHVMDVPPLLGTRDAWADALMLNGGYDDMGFAPRMRAKWASFARDGLGSDVRTDIRIPADL